MMSKKVRSVAYALCLVPLCAVANAVGLGFSDEEPADGRRVAVSEGWMVPYEETIPGTDVVFRMTPVPGGEFLMGSPDGEEGREEDEGPRIRVRVSEMWVGECEVTWAEYHAYMNLYTPLKQLDDLRYRLSSASVDDRASRLAETPALDRYMGVPTGIDAITCPTPLYDSSFTYEPGEDAQQPAVTMTQFAAKQYTKWLSKITGREYRLPTEAEWEYAARAGSSTAFTFGDAADDLAQHAWYYDNAEDQTHPVGSKKPNAWGLYDVHGNAAEWVLDQYADDRYETLATEREAAGPIDAFDALLSAKSVWPRAYRGGSWQDDPEALRSAARAGSQDDEWTLSDPNLPVSPWWYTEYESQAVGMRIVRPFRPMSEATRRLVWEADVEDLRIDVEDRLAEGRGVQAAANPLLPKALRELPRILDESTPSAD